MAFTRFSTIFLLLALIDISLSSAFDYGYYYPTRKLECPPCSLCSPCQFPEGPPPPPKTISMLAVDASVYLASTIEVLFRGFSLGFGMRMLKYILFQEDEALDRIRDRVYISAISGLAMAAFIHGFSLFVPMQMRLDWFEYS